MQPLTSGISAVGGHLCIPITIIPFVMALIFEMGTPMHDTSGPISTGLHQQVEQCAVIIICVAERAFMLTDA